MRFDRKIALEEHMVLPPLAAPGSAGPPIFGAAYMADVRQRLGDAERRLEDMDRHGIEVMVLSATQPGVQDIGDRAEAMAAGSHRGG